MEQICSRKNVENVIWKMFFLTIYQPWTPIGPGIGLLLSTISPFGPASPWGPYLLETTLEKTGNFWRIFVYLQSRKSLISQIALLIKVVDWAKPWILFKKPNLVNLPFLLCVHRHQNHLVRPFVQCAQVRPNNVEFSQFLFILFTKTNLNSNASFFTL